MSFSVSILLSGLPPGFYQRAQLCSLGNSTTGDSKLGIAFFSEYLPAQAYCGIALAVLGLILAAADMLGPDGSLLGDLLAFLGAVFISGYLILGRFIRRDVGTFTYTFWVYVYAAYTPTRY